MMPSVYLVSFFALALTVLLVSSKSPTDPGVGFSLSIDYGTASIYFNNGTVVDVAKVEGSGHYKTMMRSFGAQEAIDSGAESANSRATSETASFRPMLLRLQDAVSLPQWLKHAWNRWTTRARTGSALNLSAVEAMLRTLNIATESYLEGLSTADPVLAVPFPVSASGHQLLQSAARAADLGSAFLLHIAGQAAAEANGISKCEQDYNDAEVESDHAGGCAPQLVLTVDYSRSALTALLFSTNVGVFKLLRTRHDLELGTDGLRRCQKDSQNAETCTRRLVDGLREAMKMPLKDGGRGAPKHISELALLGDRALDKGLREILQQLLWEQSVSASLIGQASNGNMMIDPVFAAARGSAAASWELTQGNWDAAGSAKNDL
ncbi:MAG: hypothetical protein M4579_007460 [Chaenotheca gracillima]|nr:MAG: hypothetical protein M4579_007460 [Chaenotheca gracillima]